MVHASLVLAAIPLAGVGLAEGIDQSLLLDELGDRPFLDVKIENPAAGNENPSRLVNTYNALVPGWNLSNAKVSVIRRS